MEFTEYLRTKILEPIGMADTWLRLPRKEYEACKGRIAPMYDTEKGKFQLDILQSAEGMAICRPGSSSRGPVKELGPEAVMRTWTRLPRNCGGPEKFTILL